MVERLISFFGSRALAWLVLGGGILFVGTTFWQSAKSRGKAQEWAAWTQLIGAKQKTDRDANHRVDMRTVDETATLQEQERQIRFKWDTAGRGGAPAATKPKE